MNKWQKHYNDTFSVFGLDVTEELEMLEKVGDTVTVHFPEFKSPLKSACHPAYVKTFTVTYDDTDIPNGIISVSDLVSNLKLWNQRGYEIEYTTK